MQSLLSQEDAHLVGCSQSAATDAARGVSARHVMRWTMAALYMIAGVAHLTLSDRFLRIMPKSVPFPRTVVLLTGACEIAGSSALAGRRLRRLAGVMLALYAICVFPANVKHAIDDFHRPAGPANRWYHGPRLAFQPVLIWWALFCVGVIDWPFRTASGPVPGPTRPRGRGGPKRQRFVNS